MLRVYLAAPFPMQDAVNELAEKLAEDCKNITIVSTWSTLRHPDPVIRDTPAYQAQMARLDIDDLMMADVVVLLNPIQWINAGTGGRHFELGYAYGKSKCCMILGKRGTALHYCEGIWVAEDYTMLVSLLNRVQYNSSNRRAYVV